MLLWTKWQHAHGLLADAEAKLRMHTPHGTPYGMHGLEACLLQLEFLRQSLELRSHAIIMHACTGAADSRGHRQQSEVVIHCKGR